MANGVLDYYLHTATINGTGYYMIDAAEPRITAASAIGPKGGQLYGRYVVRARWDTLYGYHISFLLWPDSGVWPRDGEIDWPEGAMDSSTINAFMHYQGGPTASSRDWYKASVNTSDWHDYEIDWTRSAVSYYVDGRLIGQSTNPSVILDTPMHWVLQVGLAPTGETNLNLLGKGHLQIAWAVAYTPA